MTLKVLIVHMFLLLVAGSLLSFPLPAPAQNRPLQKPKVAPISTHTWPKLQTSLASLQTARPQKPKKTTLEDTVIPARKAEAFAVPFFSQFTDISDPAWQKVSCGIAGLAMLVDFYRPNTVSADALLAEGIAAGAYISSAGWKHQGLISLAAKYGLTGSSKDLSALSMEKAFAALETVLETGPVMASVHYTFDPKNVIPHLVVITGVANGLVHYNDPAEAVGGGTLSIAKFQSAWKKRYIELHALSAV